MDLNDIKAIMMPDMIAGKYRPTLKLASSPFYDVFKARHHLNQIEVVLKTEKKTLGQSKLFNEAKVLKELQGQDLTVDWGVPQVVESGGDGEYNYMVMEVFGPSLDRFLIQEKGKLGLKRAFEVGGQMLQRLQMLHSKGFVHRDIRPEHFLYGRLKRPERIYISGLSASKRYVDKYQKHAFYRDNKKSFTGTARYLSLNAHMGIEQSRRDDLQALLYLLVYMVRGSLPWQNVKAANKSQKNQKIFERKLVTSLEDICEGIPGLMHEVLLYVRVLEYEEAPDYQYLKGAFKRLKDSGAFRREQGE